VKFVFGGDIMKKIILLFFLSWSVNIVAVDDDVLKKFNVAGMDAKKLASFVSSIVEDASKTGHDKAEKNKSKIKKLGTMRIELGKQRDKEKIGKAEYDQAIKDIDEGIVRLQKDNDKMVERGDKIGEGVQRVFVDGAGMFMRMHEDQQTRKTKVVAAAAQAAAQQAEKNKGDFERLQFKMQQPRGMAGGYYLLKLLYCYLESLIGKPTLVIETSRKSLLQSWKDYWFGSTHDVSIFDDAIFAPELKERLVQFALETKQIHDVKKSGKGQELPFRNLLLYGPPGTGKSMVARKIAQMSGMEYAIIPAGNIRDEEQINQIFQWAEHTPGGMVVFIDEVETLGRQRSKNEKQLDDHTSLLSVLLARSELSKHKLAFIFATNLPEKLDDALLSRVSEQLAVLLPEGSVREQMCLHYWNKLVKGDESIVVAETLDDVFIKKSAEKLQGFSGRGIEDLFVVLRTKAVVGGAGTLSQELFEKVFSEKISRHKAIVNRFKSNNRKS